MINISKWSIFNDSTRQKLSKLSPHDDDDDDDDDDEVGTLCLHSFISFTDVLPLLVSHSFQSMSNLKFKMNFLDF